MTSPLEHQGQRAHLNAEFGYIRTDDFRAVPMGETVHLCSWHDDAGYLSLEVKRAGYRVSHGICDGCKAEMMKSESAKNAVF